MFFQKPLWHQKNHFKNQLQNFVKSRIVPVFQIKTKSELPLEIKSSETRSHFLVTTF